MRRLSSDFDGPILAAGDQRRKATMATQTLAIEVPDELLVLLGSADAAAAKAQEALVMALLRESFISQGQAARLLGLTRWDVLDLMARYAVPSGPETAEEMRAEIDAARHAARRS